MLVSPHAGTLSSSGANAVPTAPLSISSRHRPERHWPLWVEPGSWSTVPRMSAIGALSGRASIDADRGSYRLAKSTQRSRV
jgi:hypothetical protein